MHSDVGNRHNEIMDFFSNPLTVTKSIQKRSILLFLTMPRVLVFIKTRVVIYNEEHHMTQKSNLKDKFYRHANNLILTKMNFKN